MTGDELKTTFKEIVDGQVSDILMFQLFNEAKMEVEMERPWEILKEMDSSNTTSGNYLTGKTLPTRFLTALSLRIGNDRISYEAVPFEDRELWKDASHKYYIKLKDNQFFICGSPQTGQTIYLAHTQYSADIDESSEWGFPSWAHLILAIKAAKLYYPIDTGEKVRSWDDRWKIQEDVIMRRLISWDTRLKRFAKRPQQSGYDPRFDPNVAY